VKAAEVIKSLMKLGSMVTINQVLDQETAMIVVEELGHKAVAAKLDDPEAYLAEETPEVHDADAAPRAPVVTVMGHVDHGKTSLLDYIRRTRVASGEAGGITQHIGAYQVEVNGRKITFLDTPGHEAFTQMRARGAQVTDIAVIVVAADDGVMPQTIEAIDHARAAQVPLVVALNKIDRPNANPDHVKQQLADRGVVIEEYGGDVVCVPVSAKKQTGITELLEMILLVADLQDLKANPNGPAHGVVIEARLDQNTGVAANALVQDGTLKVGDTIVVGTISGRVRAMFDDKGERTRKATPSTPVSILGLSEVPAAGDRLEVVADEKAARALIQKRREADRQAGHSITLDTLYMQMREGKIKELNLLVKSDVQGSAEAIRHALTRVGEEHAEENLKVRLIQDAVGNVGETDVYLASASSAIIIAFNVKVDPAAQRLASIQGVDIRSYNIIYKLVEDIEAALKGLLEPVYREQVDGHAEVMQIFKVGRQVIIGGCRITDGKIVRSSQVRVQRGGQTVFTGLIQSIRRGKDDVREVAQGYECGIILEDYNALEVGDIIEAFSKVRV
ncbi:MAG TPA: translation initiation factor IF-2, partial [Ktedonobacterales bacterium]|nr:translation initiation factor IF-2 [Ktedonobacterales bacterium]